MIPCCALGRRTLLTPGFRWRMLRVVSQRSAETPLAIPYLIHRRQQNSFSTTSESPRSHLILSTPSSFSPSSISHRDFVDLSDAQSFILTGTGKGHHKFHYSRIDKEQLRFPPGSRGFFYLYRPTKSSILGGDPQLSEEPVHPAAGELRFRVTETADPTKFDEGVDLHTPNGMPWKMHILHLSRRPHLQDLSDQILTSKERTLVQDFLARSRLHPRHYENFGQRSIVLNHILEPFLVNFKQTAMRPILLDRDVMTRLDFGHWLNVQRSGLAATPTHPYSGKAIIRFDLVLSERKYDVPSFKPALRVLRWVEPPNPGDTAFQREGELLKRWDPVRQVERVWTMKGGDALPASSFEQLVEERSAVAETIRHDDRPCDPQLSSLHQVTIKLA